MSSATALDYARGQCTRFVAQAVDWIGNWGNAGDWAQRAAASGRPVTTTPTLGSVAAWAPWQGGASGAGHVAEVVGFQANGLPIVVEQNWGPNGVGINNPDYRGLSASEAAAARYIQPPAGSAVPTQIPASVITAPDAPKYGAQPAATTPAGSSTNQPFLSVDWGKFLPWAADQLPGQSGSLSSGAMEAAAAIWDVFSTGIANFFARLGHGIASFISGTADGLGSFAKDHAVPLAVAGVVTATLFA
jgi:hypothetical protein